MSEYAFYFLKPFKIIESSCCKCVQIKLVDSLRSRVRVMYKIYLFEIRFVHYIANILFNESLAGKFSLFKVFFCDIKE